GDALGMQEVAAEGAGGGSVKRVAGHRMTNAGQMHTNLMRAAGSYANFEERKFVKAPQHLVYGNRGAPASQFCRHSDAANRIASDGCGDPALVRLNSAVNQRQI